MRATDEVKECIVRRICDVTSNGFLGPDQLVPLVEECGAKFEFGGDDYTRKWELSMFLTKMAQEGMLDSKKPYRRGGGRGYRCRREDND